MLLDFGSGYSVSQDTATEQGVLTQQKEQDPLSSVSFNALREQMT